MRCHSDTNNLVFLTARQTSVRTSRKKGYPRGCYPHPCLDASSGIIELVRIIHKLVMWCATDMNNLLPCCSLDVHLHMHIPMVNMVYRAH
jgi:hypothetical protein